MSKVDVLASSKNQRWITPHDVFNKLHQEFNFHLDAAAERVSAKIPNYLGPDHEDEARRDALKVSWSTLGVGKAGSIWVNPPYGHGLDAWLKKFYEESRHNTVVVLIYSRTETKWFHQYVWKAAEIRFLPKRLVFLDPDTLEPAPAGATAGHMVVVWRPETHGFLGHQPNVRLWDWRK